MEHWKNKRVLVTGACGTVGSELVAQILTHGPAQLIGLDNNESALFFEMERYKDHPEVQFFATDVRDARAVHRRMEGIEIVIHAAALKHVGVCERSPGSAVQTNIEGVQNIIDAASARGVERVLFTSSDKAVNPTSVMGTSKLMGERLLSAANANGPHDRPLFASTRFGNVLGSNGSVIPLFRRQIQGGGPVTLTDPGMSRFVMTLPEAAALVMSSLELALGGEIFVTKMPVIGIEDLAHVMIDLLAPVYGRKARDIDVTVVGSKPGEKLYEELVNEEEVRRTVELDDFYVLLPALRPPWDDTRYEYSNAVQRPVTKSYRSDSEEKMSRGELAAYLVSRGLLEGKIDPGICNAGA